MNRFFRTLDTLVFGKKFTVTEEDSLRGACMDVLCLDNRLLRDCDESEIKCENFKRHLQTCTGSDILLFVKDFTVWVMLMDEGVVRKIRTCDYKVFMEYLSINTPIKRTMRSKGMALSLGDTVSVWIRKMKIAWREAGSAA